MNVGPIAPRVVSWDDGIVVYVASLPRGPIAVLDGTAAVIWRALAPDDIVGTVARVAVSVGAGVEEVRPVVEEFVARLGDAGLLPGERVHLRY